MAQQNQGNRTSARKVRAIQAKQRKQRMWFAGGVSALVLVGIVILVAVGGSSSKKKAPPAKTTAAAPTAITTALAQVPLADIVKASSVGTNNPLKPINAPALKDGAKPQVLYVGAEYCPYCAAERWGVAIALAKFGTFNNLGTTHSSSNDIYPNTATLSFHGSTYASDYISFVGKELASNQPNAAGTAYAPLDTLTPGEQSLVSTYNAPPYTASSGGIPFIDVGGKYVQQGATYNPQVLAGKTASEIAAALADPTSDIATSLDSTAAVFIKALCTLTNGQPGAVCSAFGG